MQATAMQKPDGFNQNKSHPQIQFVLCVPVHAMQRCTTILVDSADSGIGELYQWIACMLCWRASRFYFAVAGMKALLNKKCPANRGA